MGKPSEGQLQGPTRSAPVSLLTPAPVPPFLVGTESLRLPAFVQGLGCLFFLAYGAIAVRWPSIWCWDLECPSGGPRPLSGLTCQ